MNRVEIRGGVTQVGDVVWLPSGDPVVEFTLALNGTRWSKEQNAQVVKTTYVRVAAYARTAEALIEQDGPIVGDDVYVLGELDQTEREVAGGKKEKKTRVTAFQCTIVRRRAATRDGQKPPW